MSRIRTIKPEFWTSEQVVKCSLGARLLFIGLWNFCDDAGIHPASVCRIKMEIFPGDNFTVEEVEVWIKELVDIGLLQRYTVDGIAYLWVTGWHHQRIEKPTFRYPGPKQESQFDDHSTTTRRLLDDRSATEGRRRRKGREGNGKNIYTVQDLTEVGSERWSHSEPTPPPPPKNSSLKNGEQVFTSIPLVDGTEVRITENDVREWEEAYPAVNVRQELREIRQWNLSNPKKRKTRNGWPRHVTEWLGGEQDRNQSHTRKTFKQIDREDRERRNAESREAFLSQFNKGKGNTTKEITNG